MSDFNSSLKSSPFDRDMYRAAKLGAMAAASELAQPGILAGSQKLRHDFRKGILARYVVTPDMSDEKAWKIADQRASLNQAYYAQDDMISEINREPEVKVVEIVIPAQRTAELVSA